MPTDAILSLLVDACRRGDPYTGLRPFTASLRRKLDGSNRDEAAANTLLNQAFCEAILPYRCAESAQELGSLLFLILSSFGHRGDAFGVQRVREVHRYFVDDLESNQASWWRAHVEFLHHAREWWRGSGVDDSDFAEFIQEALANTHMRLLHCADACGDQSAATDSLTAAFRESLLCFKKVDLIVAVMGEMTPRLNPEEQPLLIARAVYGLLATGATTRSREEQEKSLDAAHILLSRYTGSDASVTDFLADVVTVLRSPDRSGSLPADQRPHCVAVAALCKAYEHTLWHASDLQWKEIVRFF